MRKFGTLTLADLASSQLVKALPGKYSGLAFHFIGTNGGGLTRTTGDNGTIELKLTQNGKAYGRTTQINWALYAELLDILGGHPMVASAIGGTFEFYLKYPFGIETLKDGNCLDIGSNDLLEIWVPTMTGVGMAAAQLEVFGIEGEGSQDYLKQMLLEDVILGGTEADRFPVDNMALLFAKLDTAGGATTPTSVQLTKNGRTIVHAHTTLATLTADTRLDYNVESGTSTTGFVKDFTRVTRDLRGAMGDTFYHFEGGSGDIDYLAISAMPSHPSVVRRSQDRVLARMRQLSSQVSSARVSEPAALSSGA